MGDGVPIQHSVVEASAGTGKTHKIVQKVLAALEAGIRLDEILLVTYTEKAAGELKERVRRGIEEKLERTPENAAWKDALENFENARISTIHGFCQSVLRQHPLAGGAARARMAGESDIAEICLREFQRREWPGRHGSGLLPMLELSGYCDDKSGGNDWEQAAAEVLARFKPECGHVLLPDEAAGDSPATLEARLRKILADFEQKIGAVGAGGVNGANAREHPLVADFNPPGMRSNTREACLKWLLLPLLELVHSHRDAGSLARFQELSETARNYKNFKTEGFCCLVQGHSAIKKDTGKLKGLAAELPEFARSLDSFSAALERFKFRLSSETVRGVLETQRRYKREHGLQSYDDLLGQVHRAILDPDGGPALVEALRRQFRLAIVDEFQDTDPIQWEIFERIFLDSPGGRNALAIVGDPKQAIYSFRGADVNTYLRACAAVRKKGGSEERLDTCWRASAEMNRALNVFFESGELLGGGISYQRVSAPAGKDCARLERDESGRAALTIVEFGAEVAGGSARSQMAEFIAAECARLLAGPALKFERRGEPRELSAGDIAVLFFKRSEAPVLEKALRARGIPYTFYKKSEMWASEEAVQLWYVLNALAQPEDRAAWRKMLLTRFCGLRVPELSGGGEAAPEHPFMALAQRWREACRQREWAELFRSMLEDTGLLDREALEFDGARRIANWRFITQTLAREACAEALDIAGVRELLRERRQLPAFDDGNLHPLESERPAVKLMTVFASKGLEFPVVFLAGGYGGKSRGAAGKAYCKYHDEDGRVVYAFGAPPESRERWETETLQEQQRMLYVAMTRPMFKLYVPVQSQEATGEGRRNPWTGPLRKLLQPCVEKVKRARCEEIAALPISQLQSEAGPRGAPQADARQAVLLEALTLPRELEIEPQLAALAGRVLRTHSYTGLVHAHKRAAPRWERQDREQERAGGRDDDEDGENGGNGGNGGNDENYGSGRDDRERERPPDALPSSKYSGIALHTILEWLNWEAVRTAASPEKLLKDADSRGLFAAVLERQLPDVKDRAALNQRAAELVFTALRAPLKALDGMSLCDVPLGERAHEVEFHLPFPGDIFSSLPEELARDSGFLTGSMDLVLRAAGRYFLLDWKSNTLDSYAPGEVERDVKARRYDLQYRIYLQAIQKWLGPLGATPENFGGVLYVYLRGIGRAGAGEDGIYFRRPPELEWQREKLIADLRTQAGKSALEGGQR